MPEIDIRDLPIETSICPEPSCGTLDEIVDPVHLYAVPGEIDNGPVGTLVPLREVDQCALRLLLGEIDEVGHVGEAEPAKRPRQRLRCLGSDWGVRGLIHTPSYR